MQKKENQNIREKHLYIFHDFEQTRQLPLAVKNHIWKVKEALSSITLVK